MLQIRHATTPADFDAARALVASFISWLRVLYAEDTASVDEYFQAIQPELASLPGAYGPPSGCMLLAWLDDKPVGMVALRSLGPGTCEMKRMFVQASLHGRGVGKALADALLTQARSLGYARMRLDTSHRQVAAIRLYRRLGFHEIEPYYAVSELLRATLIFMEFNLEAKAAQP